MSPPAQYGGPQSLGFSRYASSPIQRAAPAIVPLVAPSAPCPSASNIIATKEQIAAAAVVTELEAPSNSDAELAVDRGHALKEQVDKHATQFSRSISSAVSNTRRLLELIRESVQKENVQSTKALDDLWVELEQLFAAANDNKAAVFTFMEKQRDNMSLYHASKLNETIRETQEELNMQHRKVNIQHNLILEHQEAYRDYKAQTATKLEELTELKERVSRLTLEKGNFRTEIDKYRLLLESELSTKVEDARKAEALQKELKTLATVKQQLVSESDTLRHLVTQLQEQLENKEEQVAQRFVTDLKIKTEELAKESQKAAGLTAMIAILKDAGNSARLEADKANQDLKLLGEKYKNQTAEYTNAFVNVREQTKKVEVLTAKVEHLERDKGEVEVRLAKLQQLETQNTKLLAENASMLQQVDALTAELKDLQEKFAQAAKETQELKSKLQQADKEVENLEMENNDLLAKQADAKKATVALQALQNEHAALLISKHEPKAPISDSASRDIVVSSDERAKLGLKIEGLEQQKRQLETDLEEWTKLAKRSYNEYKDMLPTYKQANEYRQQAVDKDVVINTLRLELSAAKASQANGVGRSSDNAYWKEKYESLLATISG
ncbi:hypothetical protein ACN47E_002592 [Coniothyrium glycines]